MNGMFLLSILVHDSFLKANGVWAWICYDSFIVTIMLFYNTVGFIDLRAKRSHIACSSFLIQVLLEFIFLIKNTTLLLDVDFIRHTGSFISSYLW